MYLLLWKSPGLALGGLCCASDCARRGACDGWGGPNGLELAIKGVGVAIIIGLVAVRDAMDRQGVESRPGVSLLMQSVLDRGSGVIVARIWGRAEPHATEFLVHPAVNALPPRHGLARVMSQDSTIGPGVDGQVAVGISEVCTHRTGGRDHRCNTHAAGDRGDEMLRKHVSGRRGLLVLMVLETATGRTEHVDAIIGSGRGIWKGERGAKSAIDRRKSD